MSVHRDDLGQAQSQTGESHLRAVPGPHAAASDASVQTQISFAQAAFANIQDLNRTMDQKANYVLASVALLTAALGLVVSRAVAVAAQEDWQRVLKGAGMLLTLVYLLLAFAVIFVATNIYQARSPRVSATTAAPGMLFPLMILSRYSVAGNAGETAYLARLRTLQADEILQDYSNQIIEISIIYEEKQKQVNSGLLLFRWTGVLWLITMLVVVIIVVVLP